MANRRDEMISKQNEALEVEKNFLYVDIRESARSFPSE
jgi:hypothetical protein